MKHIVIPALALCLGAAALPPVSALSANAAEVPDVQEPAYTMQADDGIQPYALTQLTIGLRPSETTGYIEVVAKNTFTLFSSTVYVRLYLYSSTERTTDRTQMELVKLVVAPDLDMGQTLIAQASTNGETKYWTGYMQYTINGGEVKYQQTETAKYDGNGTILDIIN